ncbi:MAG: ABC transporter permease [Pelolinea sp.]|nr:ABC transporter permease [Pelolinea sp.]
MKAPHIVRRKIVQHALSFVSAIILALVIGLAMLALDGFALKDVINSAFSSTFASSFRFANMVSRMIIIILVALAAAIPFKAGIWNIGGDGQLAVGGFLTALAGFYIIGLPPVFHVSLAILAGMFGGALWASISAYIRLKFNANEIVTTIMMNYLAVLLTGYLVNYPFRAPGSSNAETSLIRESAMLTRMLPLSNLSSGMYVVLAAFLIICFIDWKTSWGYEWRVLGANDEFARYGGVKDKRMRFLSMIIGGALAGLAGAILVLGVNHKYMLGMGGGVGFTGVLIALIAANSPILILIVSMIFAILQSGMIGLESKLGVATEYSSILQSVIILLVITRSQAWSSISNLLTRRSLHGKHD